MKNHKGVVATLLTLGLVVLATAITLGSSLFVSNQKTNLASNSRASESSGPCVAGQNCGSGNQWLCKPNATKVEFNNKEFDGNGCNPTACPDKARPFECYVIDDRCGGEIRSRFYGCLGQPCQNTVISQGTHGPGRLVGKTSGLLDSAGCVPTATPVTKPTITPPVATKTPVPGSTNTPTPTKTPTPTLTPTVVAPTSVVNPGLSCGPADNYGCKVGMANGCSQDCGAVSRNPNASDTENNCYRCMGIGCDPTHASQNAIEASNMLVDMSECNGSSAVQISDGYTSSLHWVGGDCGCFITVSQQCTDDILEGSCK